MPVPVVGSYSEGSVVLPAADATAPALTEPRTLGRVFGFIRRGIGGHEKGLLVSIDLLKELLTLAKEVVELERETPPEEEADRGRAALTALFEEARTPVMVKRIVDDMQNTHAGSAR